jgi:hypothetical protein
MKVSGRWTGYERAAKQQSKRMSLRRTVGKNLVENRRRTRGGPNGFLQGLYAQPVAQDRRESDDLKTNQTLGPVFGGPANGLAGPSRSCPKHPASAIQPYRSAGFQTCCFADFQIGRTLNANSALLAEDAQSVARFV